MALTRGQDAPLSNGGQSPEQALAASLHNTLAVKTKHIDSLVAHVRDLRAKLNHQSEEMAAFSSGTQERENILRQQNAQLSQQVLKLERTVAQQEKSGRELTKRAENYCGMAAEKQGQLDQCAALQQRREEESRNALDALHYQLNVLRDGKSKTVHGLHRKLKQVESRAEQSEQQLAAVQDDRDAWIEKTKAMEQSVHTEQQHVAQLRSEMQTVHDNCKKLHHTVEKLEDTNHQLENTVQERGRDLSELRQTNESLRDRCHQLEEQQLEANREAAQRLNEVSVSVKRVVQECENLRTDLTSTHKALSESHRRETSARDQLDEANERLNCKSAECDKLSSSLDTTMQDLQELRNGHHAHQTETAMYQTLLKDQSELLSTVRRVAEEEAVRYQKVQQHLEQELKVEKDRNASFSQQVMELKGSISKYQGGRSLADASLDSGLAASTLSLATAAAKMANSSGSASEVITNLQQEAELLDIRLTEEMEKHVVTLRRLHDVEEENNRLCVLVAGSPVKEKLYRRQRGLVSNASQSPAAGSTGSPRHAETGQCSVSASPVTSHQHQPHHYSPCTTSASSPTPSLATSPLRTKSSASSMNSSMLQLTPEREGQQHSHQQHPPQHSHQQQDLISLSSPLVNGLDASLLQGPSTDISFVSQPTSPATRRTTNHAQSSSAVIAVATSLPATPVQTHCHTAPAAAAASTAADRRAWTSPARKSAVPSDASLLAQSLVRRALFQDLPGTQRWHKSANEENGSRHADLARPLELSFSERLDAVQQQYEEQMKKSVHEKQLEVERLQSGLTSSQQTSDDLRKRLSEFESDLKSVQQSATEASQRCHGHQQLLVSRTEQLKHTQIEVESLRAELARSNQSLHDIVSLNWPVSEGESVEACTARVLEAYYSLPQSLKSSEERYSQCHAALQQKINEYEQCLGENSHLTAKHASDLTREMERSSLALEHEKAASAREQERMREENDSLRSTVAECNAQMQLLQSSRDKQLCDLHDQQHAELAGLANKQHAEVELLQSSLAEHGQLLAAAQSHHTTELVMNRQHTHQLVEEERKLADEKLASLNAECAALKCSIADYEQQVDSVSKQYAESAACVEQLSGRMAAESQSAQDVQQSMKCTISKLEADLQLHMTQINDLKQQLLEQQQEAEAKQNQAFHNEKVYKQDLAAAEQSLQSLHSKSTCLNNVHSELAMCHASLLAWWSNVASLAGWKRIEASVPTAGDVADKCGAVFVDVASESGVVQLALTLVACHAQLRTVIDVLIDSALLASSQVPSSSAVDVDVDGIDSGSVQYTSAQSGDILPTLDQLIASESSQVLALRAKLEEVMMEKKKTASSCGSLSTELSKKSSQVDVLEHEVRDLQQLAATKKSSVPLKQASSIALAHSLPASQESTHTPVPGAEPTSVAVAEHHGHVQELHELRSRIVERDQLLNKAQEMLEQAAVDNEQLGQQLTEKSGGMMAAGFVCRHCKSQKVYRQLTYCRMRLGYCLLELRVYKQVTAELQGRISQLELHLKLADNQYQLCHEKLLLAEQLGLGDESFTESTHSQSLDNSPQCQQSLKALLQSPACSPPKRRHSFKSLRQSPTKPLSSSPLPLNHRQSPTKPLSASPLPLNFT
eukprot:scpid60802/ scgid22919/ 